MKEQPDDIRRNNIEIIKHKNNSIMKKILFTSFLIALSGWWMTVSALCMVTGTDVEGPYVSLSGTIKQLAMPCPDGDSVPCPPCLTAALVTGEKTFYLTTTDPSIEAQLETLEEVKVTISGVTNSRDGYDFIQVSNLSPATDPIPSLCDEWHVLGEPFYDGYLHSYTFTQQLTTDTLINGMSYVRLMQGGGYLGAMREGDNRDIYYIPAGSEHEYLLYAFNTKEGDRLTNLWFGGTAKWWPNGFGATIQEISNNSPRVFSLEAEIVDSENSYTDTILVLWIEGVGLQDGPVGDNCFYCEDDYWQSVLCAYKDGQQVYVSEAGEKVGCEYNTEEEKKKLTGSWQVYKATYTGIMWDEEGAPYTGSRTYDVNTDRYWVFDGKTAYEACNTCKPSPKPYTMQQQFDGTWLLTIHGVYDMAKPSDPAASGNSPITIHKMTEAEIEWEYTRYGGDEGPDTYYQYLRHPKKEETDTDTIPLYTLAGDNPGSSTIDPVDPNQVVVTLTGNELTIREHSGALIGYSLTLSGVSATSPHPSPKEREKGREADVQTETFQNSITVILSDEGEYGLLLTNPNWEHNIGCVFLYPQAHNGIDPIPGPDNTTRKIIHDGQLYILRDGHLYTITGVEVR